MKIFLQIPLAVLVFSFACGSLRADGDYNFAVTLAQKKIGDAAKSDGKGVEAKREKWAFTVTMENQSFKDVPAAEIKYVVFVKPEKGNAYKGQTNLERHEGTVTVPGIKNNDKFTFDTDAVEITDLILKSGYMWANGSTGDTRDKLRGIWLRLYINGQSVYEFVSPQDLHSRETFEAAAK